MPEFIDAHAHTAFDAFDEDRAAVYDRAREAGVVAVVEIGVGLAGTRRALELAAGEGKGYLRAAGGLHPTDLDTYEEDWAEFEALAESGALVAVGECGLDFYWDKAPRDKQAEAFRRQIRLARRLGLPYIVHCRDAEEDLLAILEDEGYPRGVIHCFSGTKEQALRALGLGLHLSFTGNVTYKKNAALREAAAAVPLDRLLLETDSPFLAPQGHRGKRNEPAFVAATAAVLAETLQVPLGELAEKTTRNARRFFGLG